jgi:hypothetical protein
LARTVSDELDSTLASAVAVLRDAVKGVSREANTEAARTFGFAQVPPGTHELAVENRGSATARLTSLLLNLNNQPSERVRRKAAQRDDVTRISGVAPLVSQSPAVATAADQDSVGNQPLNGRSFQSLTALPPGAQLTPSGIVDQSQLPVNGRRTATGSFTVNGVRANFGTPFAFTP